MHPSVHYNIIYNSQDKKVNQSELDMLKQEMARVNTDILGISELKWTGMGKFNSDEYFIHYFGEESLR